MSHIGYELLSFLQRRLKSWVIIRLALLPENLASIRLHEKVGFLYRGELKEVGFKFGKWVDVCLYQKMLEGGEGR